VSCDLAGPNAVKNDRQAEVRSEDAQRLLAYASEEGLTVPDGVRTVLLDAADKLRTGAAFSSSEHAAFLRAYGDLAQVTKPISAQSLSDTDDARGTRGPLRRLLGRRSISEAKQVALRFALRAFLIIACIVLLEVYQEFARDLLFNRDEVVRLTEEQRKLTVAKQTADRQLREAGVASPKDPVHLDSLNRQVLELGTQVDALQARILTAAQFTASGFSALGAVFTLLKRGDHTAAADAQAGEEATRKAALAIKPVATIIGGFVLPLLYGALGASAYILRSVVTEMHARSFDRRKVGDYGARVYLGMLNGLALQFFTELLRGAVKEVPGGLTPSLIAFLGGYSVEAVASVIDKAIRLVTDWAKPAPK
jgi:hypothetical protein